MKKMDISTILASAIHESKNQVGTLLYQLQMLKESIPSNDSNSSKIMVIEESLKKLNDEWVEYLYLYKLASDGYQLHVDTFSIDEFLDDQVFALLSSANAKKLELSYQCSSDLMGVFDERLMTAVVGTAVYNALRFARTKIEINAKIEGDFLVIGIDDDGTGFNSDEEDFLESNTGLGLYFAQLSANAHISKEKSGFLKKETSPSLKGARLAIYLPQ